MGTSDELGTKWHHQSHIQSSKPVDYHHCIKRYMAGDGMQTSVCAYVVIFGRKSCMNERRPEADQINTAGTRSRCRYYVPHLPFCFTLSFHTYHAPLPLQPFLCMGLPEQYERAGKRGTSRHPTTPHLGGAQMHACTITQYAPKPTMYVHSGTMPT